MNWIIRSESIRPGPGAGRSQARRLTLWTGRGWEVAGGPPRVHALPWGRLVGRPTPLTQLSASRGREALPAETSHLGWELGHPQRLVEERRRKRGKRGDPYLLGCGLPHPPSKPCKSLERLNFQPLMAGDTEAGREHLHCSRSNSLPSGRAQRRTLHRLLKPGPGGPQRQAT